MTSTHPYFTLVFIFFFLVVGIYFWMKGTGRIKNTNPDYEPSLGIFKVSGIVMVVSALVVLAVSLVKFFR